MRLTFTWPPSDRQPAELSATELFELARDAHPEADLAGLEAAELVHFSFDGRRRAREWRLEVELTGTSPVRAEAAPEAPAEVSAPRGHVAIVGSGPAGLFAALELVSAGVRVTLLERGFDVQRRRSDLARIHRGEPIDADSNYCHGEGGAGTYSDGKLYTRSGKPGEIAGVLRRLVEHGAPGEIETSWRPHIGSNRLPKVVTALRESIEAKGGRVLFGARATELLIDAAPEGRRVAGVGYVQRGADGEPETTRELAADAVIVATGHSALDVLGMLKRAGVQLEAKGFAMGVRVEYAQGWLDRLQYGGLRDERNLPAAFFELVTERKRRGVYSFCMCPGGFIVPASTGADRLVVNGMSLSRRDSPFANSGVVVAIEPEDLVAGRGMRWGAAKLLRAAAEGGCALLGDMPAERLGEGWLPDELGDEPMIGVAVQRALEFEAAALAGGGNRAPAQRTDHFAAGRGETSTPLETSYQAGLVEADLARFLPRGISERMRAAFGEFDHSLPGFAGPEGQVIGVESRTSSPVRVPREKRSLESLDLAGLYPAGEGAGYAGGIVSAAIDGVRVGRAALLALT
jgi:uncharacterized FAD-dependent dehydrogenase